MLPLVIVNPTSAGGATRAHWPGMAADLRTHFGPYECVFTARGGDARAIAARETRAGRELIVACGGDGTINETVNGIVEAGAGTTELGVLPSGTGGDFRRTLGIPPQTAEAARALRNGRTRRIDVGRMTYGARGIGELETAASEALTRYFVNVVSFGMGGEVVRRVKDNSATKIHGETSRLFGGKVSFAVAALETTLTFAGVDLWIKIEDKNERRLRVANLSIANARYIGGGMKMAPQAALDDGLFDIVAVGDIGARKILANAYKLYRGSHLDIERVHHTRARSLIVRAVESEAKVTAEVDGELIGHTPARFDVLPLALRVRCPA